MINDCNDQCNGTQSLQTIKHAQPGIEHFRFLLLYLYANFVNVAVARAACLFFKTASSRTCVFQSALLNNNKNNQKTCSSNIRLTAQRHSEDVFVSKHVSITLRIEQNTISGCEMSF